MSQLRGDDDQGADRGPRHHQVWRREFWTRPALLVLYGMLLLSFAGAMARAVPTDRREAAVVTAENICRFPVTGPCLAEAPGWAQGPYFRYRRPPTWHFVEHSAPDDTLDVVHFGMMDTWRLWRVRDQTVTALVHEGEVVAVRLPDGGLLETDRYGDAPWLTATAFMLMALGGAALLFGYAASRRRVVGGWWGMRKVGGPSRPGWWTAVGVVPLTSGVAALLSVMTFSSVPLSIGSAAVGAFAAGAVARIILLDRDATPTRLSHRAAEQSSR